MHESIPPGTQIIYVPPHAHGDINHPSCEHGFVTSIVGTTVFCRFWLKGTYTAFDFDKFRKIPELRTTSCGEACHIDSLVIIDSVRQMYVEKVLEDIQKEESQLSDG